MSNKEQINEFLEKMRNFTLPNWEKLPDLDLYKDQVVTYVFKGVSGVVEKNCITDSMINNYVKGRIIPAPVQKKYNNEHIAQIFGIVFLKSILPISDIKKLYDGDYQVSMLYDYLRSTLKDAFANIACQMSEQIENCDLENIDDIKLMATKLAIDAYASKMLSLQLLSLIEDESEEEKHEEIKEEKKKEKKK